MAVPALRGDWLGHALHPVLADLPIGLWTASMVLDLVGGKARQTASRRLVGLGLVAAVPTAAAGFAEWESLSNRASHRVATAHALGNTLVIGLFLRSWLSRRSGKHVAGALWGLAGGVLAAGTGYLGGDMAFGLGDGTGERESSTAGGHDAI